MTRIMRDSTTATDIPVAGTQLAAGYVNGRYAWAPDAWGRFPGAAKVTIDVLGTDPGADVLDVENGDATPAQAASWVSRKLAAHPHSMPVVYCNRGNITAVFNAMDAAGHKIGKDFWTWVATLDGTTHLADMTGVVAIQDKGETQTGGHYDESVVYDAAWKAPAAPPAAALEGFVVSPGQAGGLVGRAVTSHDGGKTWA